jgi:hypothetical protein
MRVTFETPATGVGFFPGLAKPVVIESDQLTEAETRELGELVAATRFFDQPVRAGGALAPGAADYQQYIITIEQDSRRHTLHVTEPIDDPELRRLVRFLEARAKEARAKARTGKAP